MPENSTSSQKKIGRAVRHTGRGTQVLIYLGKLLRMFVYQNDWKMLPMAALIGGLVGMVIHNRLFINMEGTALGAFALACVAIWNGCFNSIQVICRERDVIKREHRSGLHISSYIIAHMIYQALLCLLQMGITMYICRLTGVRFPQEGLFTSWGIVDFGITMFLITYAADMMALWISALSRTTTAAMTIMPFVLIFQLIFSGGMIKNLPTWTAPVTNITISNSGLKALASQADYNSRPMASAWSTLVRLKDTPVGGTVTLKQIEEFLSDPDNEAMAELRDKDIDESMKLGDLFDLATAAANAGLDEDKSFEVKTTVGQIIELAGEENARKAIEDAGRTAGYEKDYEYSRENVIGYWADLILFALSFAFLAMFFLEFIDKDRR